MLKRLATAIVVMSTGSGAQGEVIRERPVFAEQSTSKSAAELSACFGRAWERRSGQTAYYPTPHGFTMKLSYAVAGSPITAVLVDVDDRGAERRVTVRAQKGDENEKLRLEVSGCL